MHSTSMQQRQYVIARRLQPDSKYIVLYDSMYESRYVRVYTSMYEYIRVYKSTFKFQYNQGLQIFMTCTDFFFTFCSKIQTCCAQEMNQCIYNQQKVTRRHDKTQVALLLQILRICTDILSTWQYIRRYTELPEFFFFTLFFHF